MNEKILVIDDEKHVRMLYQEELQHEGYEVIISDGREPITDLVKRENPAIIILDIKLGPDLSGLDLLQVLRGAYPDLPVILCTAYNSFQHDIKSIAADFYVVKSVEFGELKAKIKEAIATKSG